MRETMRRRKRGWIGLARRLRGGARAAVIFARFDRGDAGGRGRAMPKRPEALILCFTAVAGRRRWGEPGPRTVRRLTDAARALPRPEDGRAAAVWLRLDQAYREFRGGRGLDGMPQDARAALPPPNLPPAFDPLLEPSRYKGAFGGRGSGKSHAFAELLVRRCVEKAPVRAVCIREVQRSLDQSVKRLIEDKIQALGLGPAFTVQADRI